MILDECMSNLSKEYDEVVAQIKELDGMGQEINDEIESIPANYAMKRTLLRMHAFLLLSNVSSLKRDKILFETQECTRGLMCEGSFDMDKSVKVLEKSIKEESLIKDHIRSANP